MTENNSEIKSNRQNDLAEARNLLKKLSDRINADRFREYETDNTFLKFCRAYTAHFSAVSQVSKDQELEVIEARLSELEATRQQEEKNNES